MEVQQSTKALFLSIFFVASCTTAITIDVQQNSTTYSCHFGNSTSLDFQNSLDQGINNLKVASKSGQLFKYYSPIPIDSYTPLVHVSYFCEGDIDPKTCEACVSRATQIANDNCRLWSTEGVVYEDKCTFRYSDKPFYGQLDNTSFYLDLENERIDPNSVSAFTQALGSVVQSIELTVKSGPSYGLKFATNETKVDATTTIYAMGECTWELYQEYCRLCIHDCASKLNFTAPERVGGRVMLPSCNFQYSTTLFYKEGSNGLPLPLPHKGRPKKVDVKAAVAGSAGGGAGMLAGAALSWVYNYQKRKNPFSGDQPEDVEAGEESPGNDPDDDDPTATAEDTPGATDGEAKEGTDQTNDEEAKKRRLRKPRIRPSRGYKKNTANKPAAPR